MSGLVTKFSKRSTIVLITFVLVLIVAFSSFVYLSSQKPYNGEVESITVGTAFNEVNSLIYIANDQKYFAANGLNVTIKSYISGLASTDAMLNGEVDLATAADYVFATKALTNASIYTIGTIDKFFNEYVVARSDSGIDSISDLKGKKIGVSFGTSPEFYLGRLLELNGIDLNQVIRVNVPPPQTPSALANGTVDAVIAWQPYIDTIGNVNGIQIVMWPAQADQATYLTVICQDSWAANHPELVTRFLNSLAQAESYVINTPDKAKSIVQKHLNYSAAYVAAVWSDHDFSLLLDQSLILAMQDESRWLIRNNLTNATVIPNFLNYVYVDGLKVVKPESVSIIR